MKVGVPKEIKNNENRVGMTPSGVAELIKRGHTVFVQHTAGEGMQERAVASAMSSTRQWVRRYCLP